MVKLALPKISSLYKFSHIFVKIPILSMLFSLYYVTRFFNKCAIFEIFLLAPLTAFSDLIAFVHILAYDFKRPLIFLHIWLDLMTSTLANNSFLRENLKFTNIL